MKKDMAKIVNEEWSLVKEIGEARFLIHMPNSQRDHHKNLDILKNVTEKEDHQISHQGVTDESVVLGYLNSHVKGEDPFDRPFHIDDNKQTQLQYVKKKTLEIDGFKPSEIIQDVKIVEEVKKISQDIRFEGEDRKIAQKQETALNVIQQKVVPELQLQKKVEDMIVFNAPKQPDKKVITKTQKEEVQVDVDLNHLDELKEQDRYPSWMKDKEKKQFKFSLQNLHLTYLQVIEYYLNVKQIKYSYTYFIQTLMMLCLPAFIAYTMIKVTSLPIWSFFILYLSNIFIGVSIHTLIKIIRKIY